MNFLSKKKKSKPYFSNDPPALNFTNRRQHIFCLFLLEKKVDDRPSSPLRNRKNRKSLGAWSGKERPHYKI